MTKLNKDGLEPGQRVDAATVARLNRERAVKNAEAKRTAAKKAK